MLKDLAEPEVELERTASNTAITTISTIPDPFALKSQTQEEEDAYDLRQHLTSDRHTGTIGAIGHLVKGALGAGILGGHEAYQKGGLYPAISLQIFCGIYMTYCITILISSSQIIYKRLHTHDMSYSDIGEAALAMCPNKKLSKYHKAFRYTIDILVCIDLFGCCVCYQLIISKTIKQLVENVPTTAIEGIAGYPGLRVYLAIMIIPCILISLISNLKYLAPLSLVANAFIVVAIVTTVYYSVEEHPNFRGMKEAGTFKEIFSYLGMIVFSMSCSGIVIPVCNHMNKPNRYVFAIATGMTLVISFIFIISFFGMNAFREKSSTPITLNFPLTVFTKILKALIAIMIFFTHSLNFYTPFHLCWHYLKKRHAADFDNPKKMYWIEKIYRAIIVFIISMVAIAFPAVAAVMGFTGALCLSNMAFIWPNVIEILVIWSRPGFGPYRWRLWKSLILIGLGMILLTAGTVVNFWSMVEALRE